MPIYEYRCRACGATTEKLRSMTDADLDVPCACGTADTVRLPSLPMRPAAQTGELPMATGGGCCGGGCGCAG